MGLNAMAQTQWSDAINKSQAMAVLQRWDFAG